MMGSQKKYPGLIVVISSPSGAGKTTICHKLIKKHKDFAFSVSATTRPPRKKERDGVDYHFLSDARFDGLLRKNHFAEWADVFGYRYGTLKSEITAALKNDMVLLCDVDIQGGMSIKKRFRDAISIFIIPPSLTELKKRLFTRRTESPRQKKLRLETALKELQYWRRYDYVVLNDNLKAAVNEVDMIIAAGRKKSNRLESGRYWSRAQMRLLGLRGT
ncbi:MAG: guanylate kinase [Candidatus Zixiibacteriota bacterium]|nr:MAG: guanylate kinase [candidate division Zixibacteria bacterium]